jgi:hypothetical protein
MKKRKLDKKKGAAAVHRKDDTQKKYQLNIFLISPNILRPVFIQHKLILLLSLNIRKNVLFRFIQN